jgi:hypothetical protein
LLRDGLNLETYLQCRHVIVTLGITLVRSSVWVVNGNAGYFN